MPVEIKELVIRTVISAEAVNQPTTHGSKVDALDREEIVNEAVRKALRAIKKGGER